MATLLWAMLKAVWLFEFSDYNCGYCKRMFPTIQQLLANNDDIRLVVKEVSILSQSSLIATGGNSRSKAGTNSQYSTGK